LWRRILVNGLIHEATRIVTGGMTNVPKPLDRQGWNRTLFEALIDVSRRVKGIALEDPERNPLTRKQLILASFVLGRKLVAETKAGEHVAVLLPNVNAVAVAIYALFAYGRIPAMLNFTAGEGDLQSACRGIRAKVVLTSKRFVESAKLQAKIAALHGQARIVYLEDVRESIRLADKLVGLMKSRAPRLAYRAAKAKPTDVALVLFTSGTEQAPKAVALTHANFLANVEQALSLFDFTERDIMFNPLPVFHAFGLLGGLFLPLVAGFHTFLYPSPLHYDAIPRLFRDLKATILVGIDTFAAAWARSAGAEDFKTARLVVLGAERVKDSTRQAWREKFGVDVLEGYGATECAPVIAVNPDSRNKPGTAGKLLPDIDVRLQKVEGISEGARLVVHGPNVMAGYYFPDQPGVLRPPKDGWYDTGDIVSIDEDDYVTIIGRAKRFAKVSGEMISLAAVERFVQEAAPEHHHAVVSIPDPRKGEALLLITSAPEITRTWLLTSAKRLGVNNFLVPDKVHVVEALPLLGSGKVDYGAAQRIAHHWLASQTAASG
jgi:acyl-[acyl-carrier-protein]-phospholipid O-acyltransferase/long-chain-fatty-acid--[acyl-carrier-protein] ligase